MTIQLPLSEGALSVEQWQLLENLSGTLTPAQARWISGYFAGLDAGLLRSGGEIVTPQASRGRTLSILYGTETGNSRTLAKALAAAATEFGLGPGLSDLSDYKVRQLKDEQDVLFIVSTYGEGDPPQPSVGFFEFLEGPRAPRLEGLRFAVLALGDSTYEKYCEAGKRIDRRLEELGATRLSPRVDCDLDYEDPAAAWSAGLLEILAADAAASTPGLPVPAVVRAAPRAGAAHDKHHPFPATVLENIRIVGRGSSKETRHLELDLGGSGLTYEPGDTLGIVPSNDARVVSELLDATALDGDEEVTVKTASVSLASALTSRFEITIASPRFIEQWAKLSGSSELQGLAGAEASADRIAFLGQHQVIDIVKLFPAPGIDAADLLAGLRPLQPRLYSLASSRKIVGEEAHITVSPVRYELNGSARGGVASTQIADRLELGSTIPVFVQENIHFRLPADDVPIIMVGPGTGIAPFRAFVQEREARAAAGRSWLFFGERNLRSDFLYQLEWQQWLKDGVLSRLDVAFSRDTAGKTYVQHRMIEQGQRLYAWLEEGAHFYVCGDEKGMARDVHQALIKIVEQEGGRSHDDAEGYVRRLAADHRYQRDVY